MEAPAAGEEVEGVEVEAEGAAAAAAEVEGEALLADSLRYRLGVGASGEAGRLSPFVTVVQRTAALWAPAPSYRGV